MHVKVSATFISIRALPYIRNTEGMKDLYSHRKETIERVFGSAKEFHGLRYTNMIGKARMEMKVGLTFACMNLKKLAKMKKKYGMLGPDFSSLLSFFAILDHLFPNIRKAALGSVS